MPDHDHDNLNNAAPNVAETAIKQAGVQGSPSKEVTSDVNLEDAFGQLFKSSVSGTGEEELLRIASDYALQIKANQFRLLLYIEHKASSFELGAKYAKNRMMKAKFEYAATYLHTFVQRWLELKKHNNSDVFVMRALDSISLRKFINENTLKVNIEK